ncbi:pyridoxal-phosphate dependent enzyme [Pseudonocardia saturnea]
MTTLPSAAPTWVPHQRTPGWTCEPAPAEVRAFHRAHEGYSPTPLVDLPELAFELSVGKVLAKDESDRFGLPAFKALGASWAVHRALAEHPVGDPVTVVAATDGNHGRAVARFARLRGHSAAIYVPTGLHPVAVRAIVDEGADLTVVDGSYDDAVAAAASRAAAPATVLVQDTAWEGYEDIPRWIVEGYDTLFAEIDDQLLETGVARPDLIAVPTGVGSLLQAALTHYRAHDASPGTAVVSVEPVGASCIAASLSAGRPTTIDTAETIMSGLNCGTPSSLAWPFIENGLDGAIAVTEEADIAAAHDLARLGVPAGPCGAAPLAGLRSTLTGPDHLGRRKHLNLGPDSTIVILITEGAASNPVPPKI